MKTLINTIELEFDIVEIHHQPMLKKNPFLIRIFNFLSSEPTEIRLQELTNLYKILKENKYI
jgi:hypothetical protein